jgi:hypothetical protein
MSTNDGSSGSLQLDGIAKRLRYPVKNFDELVSQTTSQEVNVYGTKLRVGNALRNNIIKSFISDADFPITDENDLRRKALKAYIKFIRPKIRKLNGTPIQIKRGEKVSIKKIIALKLLQEFKLVHATVGGRD